MIKKIIALHRYLIQNHHYISACQMAELIKNSAVNPIATNMTKRDSIPDDHFSSEDLSHENYKEKTWGLYFPDVYDAHYERYKRLYRKENPELEDYEIEDMALDKVKSLTDKAAAKMISSHTAFLNELKALDLSESDKIISPGSGFGHEQVLGAPLNFSGLEYQKALVDMSNQRNEQMGIPARSRQWSFLRDFDPTSGPVGDDWRDRINSIGDDVDAIYAKHACGGLTDGTLYDAIKKGVKKIFLATCCAYRYTDVSYRVLSPKNEDESPMSLRDYTELARQSKRQGDKGKAACSRIDDWRVRLLEENGYHIERGETEHGPFIRAIKKD